MQASFTGFIEAKPIPCFQRQAGFVWSVWELDKNKFLKRRHIWQAIFAFLQNPKISNIFNGQIYSGAAKKVCVPGLNCYSCPAAVNACPIGALQSVNGNSKFKFSYYVVGFLIFIGVLFGRLICGFVCPFGFLQDLIHKIPSPKIKTQKIKFLSYLKYFILFFVVLLLPILVTNSVGMGEPFFCKYICPQGTLEGGVLLSCANKGIRSVLGFLFAFKFIILAGIIIIGIFIYRPFCKWLCPLGAFYGIFNKFSFYQYHVDKNLCTGCGKCRNLCKMDVDITKKPSDAECIRCGKCITGCKAGAIKHGFNVKDIEKRTQTRYNKTNY